MKYILKLGNLAPPLGSDSVPKYAGKLQETILEKVSENLFFET